MSHDGGSALTWLGVAGSQPPRLDLVNPLPDLGTGPPWLRAAEAIAPGLTAWVVGLLFARHAYDIMIGTRWLHPLHIIEIVTLQALAPTRALAFGGTWCYGSI